MKKFIFTAGSYDSIRIYYIEANNELEALNKLKTYYGNDTIYPGGDDSFKIGESNFHDWTIDEISEEIARIN